MKKNNKKIKLFFYPTEENEKGFEAEWGLNELKDRYRGICKPCWELKYCPYGPLVEGFPLPPIPRHSAEEHNEYLKKCLETGTLGNDKKKLDSVRREFFEKEVEEFNPEKYPEDVPEELAYMSCGVFGHLCPVFFNAEGFTETKEGRRQTRSIPRDVLLRVVRRDDGTCQKCSKKILDKEIEIDHVIPISRGGATIESNLRTLCSKCNKSKGNRDLGVEFDDVFMCDTKKRINSYKKQKNK